MKIEWTEIVNPLQGIGEKKAAEIIEYREQYSKPFVKPFKKVSTKSQKFFWKFVLAHRHIFCDIFQLDDLESFRVSTKLVCLAFPSHFCPRLNRKLIW